MELFVAIYGSETEKRKWQDTYVFKISLILILLFIILHTALMYNSKKKKRAVKKTDFKSLVRLLWQFKIHK